MTKTTPFTPNEIPDDIQIIVTEKEMRCPHLIKDGPLKGKPCNRLLAVGKPSNNPIELICWRCKEKTVFKRIG